MKFYISESMGSVYWRENGEIRFAPVNLDNTFDTVTGGVVEVWDETPVEERNKIESLTK